MSIIESIAKLTEPDTKRVGKGEADGGESNRCKGAVKGL